MRFALIGTQGRSQSSRSDRKASRSGFMLIEALVALAVVLAFTVALAPVLFHAKRIMSDAGNRVAAQNLLRSLLDVPLDRATFMKNAKEGETAGLRWRIAAVPLRVDAVNDQPSINLAAYKVVATVSWGKEQTITAETVRLGSMQ
jgi:Tfp pilus assembly protein PilV